MELEILAFGMEQCSDADPFILDFLQKKQKRDEASFSRSSPSTEAINFPPDYEGTINGVKFRYNYYDTGTVDGKAMACLHVVNKLPTIIICKDGKEIFRQSSKIPYEELDKALPSYSGEFGPNERHAPKKGSPGPVDGPTRPRKNISIDSAIQGPPRLPGSEDISIDSAIQGPPSPYR